MKMKIFNWVQRRLHSSTDYCRVSQKKDVCGGNKDHQEDVATGDVETDTKALLLHNVLDCFLTIGTLGYDQPQDTLLPFPSLSPQQCHFFDENEQVIKVAVAVSEATLLVAKRSQITDTETRRIERSVVMVVEDDKKMKVEKVEVCQARISNGQLLEPLLKEDREKKENGRTTLADLFAATDVEASKENSSMFPGKKASIEANSGGEQNAACRVKHGRKIELPKKGKDSSPPATAAAKKINQLIKRMVKKKIHPADAVREREEEPLVRAREEGVTPMVRAAPGPDVCEVV